MDAKISFQKKMNTSKFIPKGYFKLSEIKDSDNNCFYYVKENGSTCRTECDVDCMKDLVVLLIDKNIKNTNLILV